MSRIESVDPDAILLITFFVLVLIAGGIYLLAEHFTRKRWPDGHGNSYFSRARRINND